MGGYSSSILGMNLRLRVGQMLFIKENMDLKRLINTAIESVYSNLRTVVRAKLLPINCINSRCGNLVSGLAGTSLHPSWKKLLSKTII